MELAQLIHDYFPVLSKHLSLTEAIICSCTVGTFEEGALLLKDGGYVNYVPLVTEGLVKVYKEDENGNELLLYYIQPGESCFMSATYCIKNEKSKVKAVVEEKATVILVPAKEALAFSRDYFGWNEFLYGLFNDKYSELLDIIGAITFNKKEKRLLDYLQKEAALKETRALCITHKEIADDLGSTREVISRLLKKLEHENYLQLAHRKIILLN